MTEMGTDTISLINCTLISPDMEYDEYKQYAEEYLFMEIIRAA